MDQKTREMEGRTDDEKKLLVKYYCDNCVINFYLHKEHVESMECHNCKYTLIPINFQHPRNVPVRYKDQKCLFQCTNCDLTWTGRKYCEKTCPKCQTKFKPKFKRAFIYSCRTCREEFHNVSPFVEDLKCERCDEIEMTFGMSSQRLPAIEIGEDDEVNPTEELFAPISSFYRVFGESAPQGDTLEGGDHPQGDALEGGDHPVDLFEEETSIEISGVVERERLPNDHEDGEEEVIEQQQPDMTSSQEEVVSFLISESDISEATLVEEEEEEEEEKKKRVFDKEKAEQQRIWDRIQRIEKEKKEALEVLSELRLERDQRMKRRFEECRRIQEKYKRKTEFQELKMALDEQTRKERMKKKERLREARKKKKKEKDLALKRKISRWVNRFNEKKRLERKKAEDEKKEEEIKKMNRDQLFCTTTRGRKKKRKIGKRPPLRRTKSFLVEGSPRSSMVANDTTELSHDDNNVTGLERRRSSVRPVVLKPKKKKKKKNKNKDNNRRSSIMRRRKKKVPRSRILEVAREVEANEEVEEVSKEDEPSRRRFEWTPDEVEEVSKEDEEQQFKRRKEIEEQLEVLRKDHGRKKKEEEEEKEKNNVDMRLLDPEMNSVFSKNEMDALRSELSVLEEGLVNPPAPYMTNPQNINFNITVNNSPLSSNHHRSRPPMFQTELGFQVGSYAPKTPPRKIRNRRPFSNSPKSLHNVNLNGLVWKMRYDYLVLILKRFYENDTKKLSEIDKMIEKVTTELKRLGIDHSKILESIGDIGVSVGGGNERGRGCGCCSVTIKRKRDKKKWEEEEEDKENKVSQKEMLRKEVSECKICYERKVNRVFLCGHPFCSICAKRLKDGFGKCPICKEKIYGIAKLFL